MIKESVRRKINEKTMQDKLTSDNRNDLQALLELDTKRFKIQKNNYKMMRKHSKVKAEKFAHFHKMEGAMQGHNNYLPLAGFHSLVTQKLD